MKYRRSDEFKRDYKNLKPEQQKAFREVVLDKFAPACVAWATAAESHLPYVWPASLRVAALRNTDRIIEMTWSFASPDGRASFQIKHLDGEWFCVWRRIGDRGLYTSP